MYSKKDDTYALSWAKRIKAINFLGGECSKCGNKDIFVLEFHHIEGEKEYLLGFNRSLVWSEFQKEASKCKLLCSNCHSEIHYIRSRGSIYKEKTLNCLKINSCSICGYKGENFRSICFHHRDPQKRDFWLSNIFSRKDNVSVGELLDEISKCDIMCKNCHRLKHASKVRFDRLKELINYKINNFKEIKRIDMGVIKTLKEEGKGVCEIARIMGKNKSSIHYAFNRI